MSMYNLVHGVNPNAALLLIVLGIDQEDKKWHSGRFRDIHPNEDGSTIILYTRNGGGNREHWPETLPEGEGCDCTGCTLSHHLPKHPNYIRDWDDDSDSTYAYVEFSVPPEYADVVKALSTGEPPKTIHEKFEAVLAEMKTMDQDKFMADPRFAWAKKLFDTVKQESDKT